MRAFLLIAAVAAVLVFGWYLMGKVDAFFNGRRQDQTALHAAGENPLRIGFCDPLAADSLSGVLEKYGTIHPGVCVSLFSGTEPELIRAFCTQKLDIIFLPENAAVPERIRGRADVVSLAHMPVVMQYGGVQIEPITEGRVWQRILWDETQAASDANRFLRFLRDETSGFDAEK